MWSNDKLLHIGNVEKFVITPHEFIIYAALLWFKLFWRKIHFVAIYALLCGAKFNPNILSVEQKWQISCMIHAETENMEGEKTWGGSGEGSAGRS